MLDKTQWLHSMWVAGKLPMGTVLWSSGTDKCIVTGKERSVIVETIREEVELKNWIDSFE